MNQQPQTDAKMMEALVCPVSQSVLSYDSNTNELVSKKAKLAFPIRNGIPILLIDEARTLE